MSASVILLTFQGGCNLHPYIGRSLLKTSLSPGPAAGAAAN